MVADGSGEDEREEDEEPESDGVGMMIDEAAAANTLWRE